jgi:hypothetical protein
MLLAEMWAALRHPVGRVVLPERVIGSVRRPVGGRAQADQGDIAPLWMPQHLAADTACAADGVAAGGGDVAYGQSRTWHAAGGAGEYMPGPPWRRRV